MEVIVSEDDSVCEREGVNVKDAEDVCERVVDSDGLPVVLDVSVELADSD